LRTDDESVVEPVLRARAAIEAQIATKDLRSICVTSHDDGDGKTTVVGALAAALAAAGHAVSVVEADLRHPALAERIGAEDSGGVEADLALDAAERASSHVTYLGATDLVALARSDVLPRHGATHPADVVTVALPKALRLLERPDAVVLVDTPSLRAAEAEVAARLSSGVLVVVDASKRRFVDTLEQALTQLRDAGATPVGVVLTRTRRRSGQGPTRYLPVGRSTATSVPRSRHATPLP
jgi:Mrp family chromosome partitioning ATPase